MPAGPGVTPQFPDPPASAHLSAPGPSEESRQTGMARPAPANNLPEYSTQVDTSFSPQLTTPLSSADSRHPQPVSHRQSLPKSVLNQSDFAGGGGTIQRQATDSSMKNASHHNRFSHLLPAPIPPSRYSPDASDVVHSRPHMQDMDAIIMSLLSDSKHPSSTLTKLVNDPENLCRATCGLLSDPAFVDMVRQRQQRATGRS